MKNRAYRLIVAIAVLSLAPLVGPAPRMEQAATPTATRTVQLEDIIAWKNIGATVLSNDGEWFAYRVAASEGDGEVVVRRTHADKELRFDAGESPAGGGGGGGRGGTAPSASLAFSSDARWMAFTTYPAKRDADRMRRQRRPIQPAVTIVNPASGEKQEYPRIRRFAFSGESPAWIALHRAPAQEAGGRGAAAPPAGGRGGAPAAPAAAASDQPKGTDLILRELATGQEINVGNVAEFAFNKDGKFLATTIDAQDKVGNGIQIHDLATRAVTVLDNGAASYERMSWTEKGDALSVLKGTDDKALKDKVYAVVGFTGFGAAAPKKTVYTPSADKSFPAGMTVGGDRAPSWTDDRQALVFGIHTPQKKDAAAADAPEGAGDRPAPAADATDQDEKVDLVLWHWKDPRLQTQQQVQEARDRAFNYLAEYRVGPQKFIRLADDEVRTVSVAPKQMWAIGFDEREFEMMGNIDGRRYQDVYAINMETGERKPVAKRVRWFNGPSPDGESVLYYEDGNYLVYAMSTGQTRNITQGVAVSFVDTEDDHNVIKPPTSTVGWTADSKSVLLSDNWDIWQVPVAGGALVNLTVNGKKDAIRYQQRFALEPPQDRDEGIDLTKPQYFRAYGEWTKKSGIARIEPGKPGAQMVMWGDASFTRLAKAKNADQYVYTRETSLEPADYYITDAKLGPGTRLTDMRPQVARFTWSPGVQLVNYTCDKGDKLQAALFLPANYEKGKAYPTLVNFYEKMSQGANQFASPSANGFNRSVYTSNGYAVLVPDITYKVNDPGMSAVWCMVPAVKAAIATGVVDPKHVGITGHSWGGYQTSFLITQTDIFAAAVAGAPLTDMVSMYSLVYKNTGGTNQAIFESSQGRFKGGYWDNWDAYYRNSPVFFAKNVKTPLMILHNDRDGAVDFTQGVEYFNTLRRLQKPVIMLEYPGENHSLARRPNQRDYTVRMKEFFDHYLMGAPAPDWLTKGVPRLQMEQHLKDRKAKPAPPKKITTTEAAK
ncbi:MAG: peptidase S9 prolyl oligopeptidase [Acidobacteria bacterium RIFCSPLOWO2_12_FULL_66_21]|nr:MAG: peptidase S9 prolyl oligopeptidase [Acidobacteria bacterium RIFCSPLOWO2_12_FULL_66_21]